MLVPDRVEGDRRRYGEADLYRIAVILRAKEAGLALDDVREMLTTRDPQQRRLVLQRRHAELRARIAQLQASSEILGCALKCDHEDFAQCADFQQMVADRIGLDPRPHPPGCAVTPGSRSV